MKTYPNNTVEYGVPRQATWQGHKTSGQPAFDALPFELRHRIYRYLLPALHRPFHVMLEAPYGQANNMYCSKYKTVFNWAWGEWSNTKQVQDAVSFMLVNRLVRNEVADIFYANVNISFATIPQLAAVTANFSPYAIGLLRTIDYLPSPQTPHHRPGRFKHPSPKKYNVLSERLFTALRSWTGLEVLKVDHCEKHYNERIANEAVPDEDFIWHSDTLDLARRIREIRPQLVHCYYEDMSRIVTLILSAKPRGEDLEHVLDVDAEWQKWLDYLATRNIRSGKVHKKDGRLHERVKSGRDHRNEARLHISTVSEDGD